MLQTPIGVRAGCTRHTEPEAVPHPLRATVDQQDRVHKVDA
jgi:hypothetical protein